MKKYFYKISLLLTLFMWGKLDCLTAQTQNGAINANGDIAFVSYATVTENGITGFAFVLLDDCPNTTTIYFTDDEWRGGPSFSTGEGDLTWTNNTGSTITRGTVIKMCGTTSNTWTTTSVNIGSVTVNDTRFSTAAGDQIYAMTGDRNAPGTFLAFVGGIATTSLSFTGTPFGTGTAPSASLTAFGVNITQAQGGRTFTGAATCNSTAAACNSAINTAGSWGTTGFTSLTTPALFFAAIPNTFTGSVFPVELTSFEGKYTGGGANLLTWTTASERDNKGFDIERSVDGKNFEAIGQIKGNNKPSTYQFIDNQPFATSYYRLKQMDFDGKVSYSAIISVVRQDKGNGLKVYPTLVTNNVLTVDTEGETRDFSVTNLLGQQVLTGTTTAQIDVSTLSQGTYLLKVGTAVAKFVKQ